MQTSQTKTERFATSDAPLAAALRRVVVAGGFIIGGWGAIYWAMRYFLFGLPFNFYYDAWWLTDLRLGSNLLTVAGATCLLVGSWGLQRHRPWGRTLLWVYIAAWTFGVVGLGACVLGHAFVYDPGTPSWVQAVDLIASYTGGLVYSSVFPAALCFLLRRPELTDTYPTRTRGFEPLPAEAADDGQEA